jgi:hypothetical protein
MPFSRFRSAAGSARAGSACRLEGAVSIGASPPRRRPGFRRAPQRPSSPSVGSHRTQAPDPPRLAPLRSGQARRIRRLRGWHERSELRPAVPQGHVRREAVAPSVRTLFATVGNEANSVPSTAGPSYRRANPAVLYDPFCSPASERTPIRSRRTPWEKQAPPPRPVRRSRTEASFDPPAAGPSRRRGEPDGPHALRNLQPWRTAAVPLPDLARKPKPSRRARPEPVWPKPSRLLLARHARGAGPSLASRG